MAGREMSKYEDVPTMVVGIEFEEGADHASLLVVMNGQKVALRFNFLGLLGALEYLSGATFSIGVSPEGLPHLPVQHALAERIDGADLVGVQMHFGSYGFLRLSLSDVVALQLADQLQQHARHPAKPGTAH